MSSTRTSSSGHRLGCYLLPPRCKKCSERVLQTGAFSSGLGRAFSYGRRSKSSGKTRVILLYCVRCRSMARQFS